MLLQKTLKISLPALAISLASVIAAGPARAEMRPADAYESLVAVPLAPGHAPRTVNGVAALSVDEGRHHERLPVQLEGPLKKIKKTKYSPTGLSRDVPTDF